MKNRMEYCLILNSNLFSGTKIYFLLSSCPIIIKFKSTKHRMESLGFVPSLETRLLDALHCLHSATYMFSLNPINTPHHPLCG